MIKQIIDMYSLDTEITIILEDGCYNTKAKIKRRSDIDLLFLIVSRETIMSLVY